MTNKEITKAYIGNTQVEKIYLGTDVVYEATPVVPTAHTASVLLDESVSIDLPESSPDIYDMVFTEPYTSITLYYDNQVVTASTLSITIEGGEAVANEVDFEVANINVDTYAGTSINAITFNAANNEVYMDFAS